MMADEIDRQQAKVSAITGAVVLAFALACYGLVRFFACYTPEPTQVLPAPGERSLVREITVEPCSYTVQPQYQPAGYWVPYHRPLWVMGMPVGTWALGPVWVWVPAQPPVQQPGVPR